MTTPQQPSQTPAGWYPDPGGSGRQRYWDGSQWTEHYAGGEAPGGDATGPPPNLWWGVPAALVVLLIGSIGPWATIDIEIFGQTRSESESGLESDGVITLVLALIAGVMLVLWRGQRKLWQAVVAAALGALSLLICIIDIADVAGRQDTSIGDISVGWGLWLALIGSIALTAVSVLLAIQSRRRTSA